MVAHRGQRSDTARALAAEALSAWRGADPDTAIDACDHALATLLPVGASDALCDVLRWKGNVLRDRGNHTGASDLFAQSLAVSDSIAYLPGRAHALNCMGTIAQLRGDMPAAERWYGEAARLAHRLGDRRLSGMVQQNLGILADVQGRVDEAVAHFRLALAAFEQEEQLDAVLWVLNNLGVLYTRESAHGRAAAVLDRALELARQLKDVASEAIVHENRALLLLATGKHDQAEEAANAAATIAEQRKDNTRRAATLRVLARIHRARTAPHGTLLRLLERALALSDMGEDVQLRAEILLDLGDVCKGAGEHGRAREAWRRALELARIAGFTGMISPLQSRLRPAPAESTDGSSRATL